MTFFGMLKTLVVEISITSKSLTISGHILPIKSFFEFFVFLDYKLFSVNIQK